VTFAILIYIVCVCLLLGADVDKNNVLFRLKQPLKQMIDPDFLLPAKLMNRLILTNANREHIKSKASLEDRNDMLLDFVLQKKDASLVLVQFIKCLQKTDQDHVCNFICCNGGKQTLSS